jgi:hypothetical protein
MDKTYQKTGFTPSPSKDYYSPRFDEENYVSPLAVLSAETEEEEAENEEGQAEEGEPEEIVVENNNNNNL